MAWINVGNDVFYIYAPPSGDQQRPSEGGMTTQRGLLYETHATGSVSVEFLLSAGWVVLLLYLTFIAREIDLLRLDFTV